MGNPVMLVCDLMMGLIVVFMGALFLVGCYLVYRREASPDIQAMVTAFVAVGLFVAYMHG